MSKSTKEIELKLEVTEETIAILKKAGVPAGFSASRATTKNLHSIYFDTPDLDLRRAKISLRIRKVGRTWLQTVKIGTGVSGGLSSPIEIEQRVAGEALELDALEDPRAKAILTALIGEKPLAPCFKTVMTRTTRNLTDKTDGSVVEAAFDLGNIVAEDKTAPLAEVELELKSGAPASLIRAARTVTQDQPFRLSPYNKAERGYRLTSGEVNSFCVPKLAGKVSLDPADNVERAFQIILRSCLDQISHNRLVILHSDSPKGPHQFRVGLRRLRSAFKLFKPTLHPTSHHALNAKARELATAAGAVRDLDVLGKEFVEPLENEAPDALNLQILTHFLAATRTASHNDLCERLSAADVNAFLFDLTAYTEERGWLDTSNMDQTELLAQPITAHASNALSRQWKKVAKYGARLDDLTVPERHEMRKALKKLRYGVDFFGGLYTKQTVKPFSKRMRRLQDIFGYLNDVAMAEKLLDLNAGPPKEAVARAQSIGFVIGWHEAKCTSMWPSAKSFWLDTKATPKFWKSAER
ncbi:chad domain-containing protein [Roseibium sp. TrichSKD4]|uniref:CYTH and CHAD domain-containing protein n=1 Tax=Roseibium sp. TrichSKD4 TaxID=744980 RepID=UPI0001E56A56|nr:CYTH and CHAD domain-containing protein [Roseibium sp. TrichSKD4]EFO32541.1 chad domain-containing protein [Roseibium sp. TrichSKD4]